MKLALQGPKALLNHSAFIVNLNITSAFAFMKWTISKRFVH